MNVHHPFDSALAQALVDARLRTLLGSPLVAGSDIKGSLTTWGPGGLQVLLWKSLKLDPKNEDALKILEKLRTPAQ